MTILARSAEADLLIQALAVPEDSCSLHSREPLGKGSVVGVEVRDSESDAELLYYVDTSRLRVVEETGMLLGTPDAPDTRIWLHPADPHLPALAPVAFGHAAGALLQRFGRTAEEEPVFIAYRPGRRAVLRIRTGHGRVWIKVVRPSRLARTVDAHAALAAAQVPTPAVIGWSPEGLILLEDAAGTPATDVAWRPEALLTEVDVLRERILRAELPRPVRGVAARQEWYAERAVAVPDAPAIAERILAEPLVAPEGGLVPVHGDLHFGQLFLDDRGAISAVIDADTAGTGLPAEDAAAFIAHAAASALMTAAPKNVRVWELSDAALDRWQGEYGVRLLTATHLLGHAVGAADAGSDVRAAHLLQVAAAVLDGGSPSEARPAAAES